VRLRSIEDKAGEAMKTFITGLRNEREDLKAALDKAETKLVVGLPVSRILEVVTKTRPQMVIMGSQGRTGLAHLYLGSKAEQVTRLCPVPVTIVKSATS
jgi:nucleotide-binding universal stress UspA family protein